MDTRIGHCILLRIFSSAHNGILFRSSLLWVGPALSHLNLLRIWYKFSIRFESHGVQTQVYEMVEYIENMFDVYLIVLKLHSFLSVGIEKWRSRKAKHEIQFP